jgi:hypothetical protein
MYKELDLVTRADVQMIADGLGDRSLSLDAESGFHDVSLPLHFIRCNTLSGTGFGVSGFYVAEVNEHALVERQDIFLQVGARLRMQGCLLFREF